MADILSLALPFFGLIALGFASGKIVRIPEDGMAWLNFLVIYLALPALFFQTMSQTPIEELANARFIAATVACTFLTFVVALLFGAWMRKGNWREATIAGVVGGYANVGYMGPGLTLAALGPQATVPTALIFVFDSTLFFTLVPILMAVTGSEKKGVLNTVLFILHRVFTHPFIVATLLGVLAAALHWSPPAAIDRTLEFLKNAAAPCALFALGVTVALRPFTETPREVPALIAIKLLLHPLLIWALLVALGGFSPTWVYTAVLMASLPPALNAFVMARQYDVYVQPASNAVLIGTIASVLTVTALLYLIERKLLPVTFFQ
ncbi:MAG: AEC family transporter [Xanthobacteraceae bacterium]|jgi:malonate transporter